MTTLQQPQHPVLGAVVAVTASLEGVAEANPSFMATEQKAATLLEIARAKAQLAELELRVLAVADDVAAESAARDVAAWLHHHTHQRPETLRADLRLAEALDRTYGPVAEAMRRGDCNPTQAHVIVNALDDLPAGLDPEIKTKAEETLVGYATPPSYAAWAAGSSMASHPRSPRPKKPDASRPRRPTPRRRPG